MGTSISWYYSFLYFCFNFRYPQERSSQVCQRFHLINFIDFSVFVITLEYLDTAPFCNLRSSRSCILFFARWYKGSLCCPPSSLLFTAPISSCLVFVMITRSFAKARHWCFLWYIRPSLLTFAFVTVFSTAILNCIEEKGAPCLIPTWTSTLFYVLLLVPTHKTLYNSLLFILSKVYWYYPSLIFMFITFCLYFFQCVNLVHRASSLLKTALILLWSFWFSILTYFLCRYMAMILYATLSRVISL